jgi:hypothetical protein
MVSDCESESESESDSDNQSQDQIEIEFFDKIECMIKNQQWDNLSTVLSTMTKYQLDTLAAVLYDRLWYIKGSQELYDTLLKFGILHGMTSRNLCWSIIDAVADNAVVTLRVLLPRLNRYQLNKLYETIGSATLPLSTIKDGTWSILRRYGVKIATYVLRGKREKKIKRITMSKG